MANCDMMAAKVAATPVPAVLEQLEQVAMTAKALRENTNELINRLGPISHRADEDKGAEGMPLGTLPPIADNLRSLYFALSSINADVIDATRRLAI